MVVDWKWGWERKGDQGIKWKSKKIDRWKGRRGEGIRGEDAVRVRKGRLWTSETMQEVIRGSTSFECMIPPESLMSW